MLSVGVTRPRREGCCSVAGVGSDAVLRAFLLFLLVVTVSGTSGASGEVSGDSVGDGVCVCVGMVVS